MEHKVEMLGRATSFNVQKVAWVIAELGLSCNRIELGGAFGGLDHMDYIAMNPNRQVPTLIDGDTVFWESNTICRYLVDAYGTPAVFKFEIAKDRGQADMWMEWFQNNVYSNFIALFYQIVRLPPSQRDPNKRADLLAVVSDALRIFDTALAEQKFIIGDRLSLGDIAIGASLYRFYTMDIERPSLPNLDRYYDGLTRRQAYQDAVMVDFSSLRRSD